MNELETKLAVVETKLNDLMGHFQNHLSQHRKIFWILLAILILVALGRAEDIPKLFFKLP